MIQSLGKFALAFVIIFGILNSAVQTLMMAEGFPQVPYLTLVFTPQTFYDSITLSAIQNIPIVFLLYVMGILLFNAFINFVFAIPIAFYELAAITGNPALIVLLTLIGFMLQMMAWYYLFEQILEFFFV